MLLIRKFLVVRTAALLLVCLCGASKYTAAQTDNLIFTHVGTNQSLLQGGVRCLFEDEAGFLWIGTDEGLLKYDGSNFTSWYHIEGDSSSLCGSSVYQVGNWAGHGLLVLTNYGISLYSYNTNKFNTVYHYPGAEAFHITADKKIVVATSNGIYIFNFNWKQIAHWGTDTKPTMLHNVLSYRGLSEDAQGNIWMASPYGGLQIWVKAQDKIYTCKNFPPQFSALNQMPLMPGRNHNVINFATVIGNKVYLADYGLGYFEYDISLNKLIAIDTMPKVRDHSRIFSGFTLDRRGNTWLGEQTNGLYSIDKNHAIRGYRHNEQDPSSICDNRINFVLTDRNDNIWVGTQSGLDLINFYTQPFNVVYDDFWKQKGVIDKSTLNALAQEGDNIYVGTYGQGLFSVNSVNRQVEHFVNLIQQSMGGNMIWNMSFINGKLWCATQNDIYTFDTKKKTFSIAPLPDSILKVTKGEVVTSVLLDKDSTLWLTTAHKGALSWSLRTKKITHYANEFGGLKGIYGIREDASGRVWFFFPRIGGLFYFDKQAGDIKPFASPDKTKLPLDDKGMNNICADAKGFVWFCTQSFGLYGWNVLTNEKLHLSRADGLCGDNVQYVYHLGDKLWIATSSGMSEFDMGKKSFINYTTEQGLPANNFTGDILYSPHDSTLYACNDFNLLYFPPAHLQQPSVVPQVYISALQVGDKQYYPIADTAFRLPFNDNNINIELAAPNLVSGKQDVFLYLIEGLNDTWKTLRGTRNIYLANMAQGTYTIHVKAMSGEGMEGRERVIKFYISAPFWRTAWFYFLIVVSIAGVFYLFYRVRLRRIIELQRTRNRIARDLHDDIGSALSSINIFSTIASGKIASEPERATQMVESISQSSQQMMETMDDIVWSINPRNDSMKSVIARMRKFSSEILEVKGIEYTFKADEALNTITLSTEYRRALYLIFKEAINNLAKYSECANASVTISRRGNKIVLLVEDNGVGFDKDNTDDSGNGLNNMRQRAEALGGKVEIESKIGQGTRISLELIIP